MRQPFVIMTLPRSRSYWLSRWLSYDGRVVGHDLGLRVNTCQDFANALWPLAGTVESGAACAAGLLRRALPEGRQMVVKRNILQVAASLERLGLPGMLPSLVAEAQLLDSIVAAGADYIRYEDLDNVEVCEWIWETLLGSKFDYAWWKVCKNTIWDIGQERVETLLSRQDAIVKLKAEVSAGGPEAGLLWLGPETWSSAGAEMADLGIGHFAEANPDMPSWYRYSPNLDLFHQMAECGVLRIWTARINCRLVGYLMFTIGPNPESSGVIVADQGNWYVAPDVDPRLALGQCLMSKALDDLSALGVHSVHLHAPAHGRGAKLGALFKRMGASLDQTRYTLHIRTSPDA